MLISLSAMHDQDETFKKFTYHPDLARLANVLGLEDLITVQSMYIFKVHFSYIFANSTSNLKLEDMVIR